MDLLARTLLAAEQRARTGKRDDLRARGVVPTPSALARHAVRHIDELLRTELALVDGLASEHVVVLDPAVGTGVWLAALLEHTHATGARSSLLGFDTDPAALHIVDSLLAPEAARQGASLHLSCANTLELATPFEDDERVRVILGNPPWAARSLARGGPLSDAWLTEFRLDHEGAPLKERRVGVLSDDYVRFFRWALEHARMAPRGALVCLATNASFLDGPVHRGMRAALLAGFDKLELLDLGGNSLLSRADRAQPDQSVFGVRVGAALTWALRKPVATHREGRGAVSFAALRGTLPEKLTALETEAWRFEEHTPSAPWFGFRPHQHEQTADGFSLADAFVFQREGVQTNRDALAIARTHEELQQRVLDMARGKVVLTASRHFDPQQARRVLSAALERGESCIERLAYRPLDERYFVVLPPLCHRPRSELLRALSSSSMSLLAVRKDRGEAAFNLFAAARLPADACYLSNRSSCRTRVFPSHQPDGSENLSVRIADALAQRVGREVSTHEVIAYALSVLGSPRHRREQHDALQRDYARLPWPRDAAHFAEAVALGRRFAGALLEAFVELPAQVQVERDVDPTAQLEGVIYRADAGSVEHQGRVLLCGLAPAWAQVRVGQHELLRLALKRDQLDLTSLLDTVARCARWSESEQAADTLLFV